MKRGIFAVAVWVLMLVTPAVAAQKSPKGGHVKPAAAAKPVMKSRTHTTKPATKVHAKTHAKSSVKVHAKTHAKTSTKSSVKTSVKTKSKIERTATTGATATVPGTTAPSTPGTLSPVQQKLQQNPNLAGKLQGRLPAGTDLMTASAGFRNLGQFVSTVNASHNHGLSFVELKRRIVVQGMSLGQATKNMRQGTSAGQSTKGLR